MDKSVSDKGGLARYLSPLQAWALSFGCAVGWGAFVMPGTAFLPVAGPLGTLIGLGIGAFLMCLIGFGGDCPRGFVGGIRRGLSP